VFSSARRRRSSKERRRDRRQSRKKTIEGRLFLANFSTNMLSPPPSLFGSAGSLSRRGPCEEKGTRRARLQRRGQLEKADPSCFFTAEVFCVCGVVGADGDAGEQPPIHFRRPTPRGEGKRKATEEEKKKQGISLSRARPSSSSLRQRGPCACTRARTCENPCVAPDSAARAERAREQPGKHRKERVDGKPDLFFRWRRWTASRTRRRPSSASRRSSLASWTLTLW